MRAADVTANMHLDFRLGHTPGLDLAVGALLMRRPGADLTFDGGVCLGIPEAVGWARAELPDAIVTGWTGLVGVIGVGIGEEFTNRRG